MTVVVIRAGRVRVGSVGWRQLVPLLRRRRNEQEPRLFPLSSLARRGMDGRRARQKVEESNQLCSSSFYSFLLRSSVRAGEALYRRYSSSVFLACITERFSQHFTFLPVRTLSSPSAARATKMTLTRSRGMSTRARRIPIHFHLVSPEEQQQSRRNQRPQRCMTKTVARRVGRRRGLL